MFQAISRFQARSPILRSQARSPFIFQKSNVSLIIEKYGLAKKKKVKKYTWRTDSNFSVSVINYGGIITNILVPDVNGNVQDVVLGFDDIDSWVYKNTPYFGCIVGRCANLITNAKFELNGQEYKLPKNNGPHSLHGGLSGFDKMVWKPRVQGPRLILSYTSKDCEEGYPGDVITNVIYEVTDDNILHVDLYATSTKPTVVNLTNHSYFNLAGHDAGRKGLYGHYVNINADYITDGGNVKYVCQTPFDLRVARKMKHQRKQLKDLYDNNFCVNCYGRKRKMRFLGRALHSKSGRYLEVHSNAPGLQFYTGNFLPKKKKDQEIKGKGGCSYQKHGGFCLQPQFYPDSINHRHFPSPVLRPGYLYHRKIKYVFGVTEDIKEPVEKNACPLPPPRNKCKPKIQCPPQNQCKPTIQSSQRDCTPLKGCDESRSRSSNCPTRGNCPNRC